MTASTPVWTVLIPLVSVVIGALIAIVGQVVVQRGTVKAEQQRINAANERTDAAVKSIVVALLRDLYSYVLAAESRCVFDPEKWDMPLNRLLDWTTRIEFAQALGDDSEAVLHAVFATELAKKNLDRFGTMNPLKTARDQREEEQKAYGYVGAVRGIVHESYLALSVVLTALLGIEDMPSMSRESADDVLLELRQRLAVENSAAEAMSRLAKGDTP